MQPINWNVDPTTFTAGLVLQQNQGGGTLMLGPAERADVIVDFSAFAGKTLILYNDAPAPWPALDPHYDYYTGAPDNTGNGRRGQDPAGLRPQHPDAHADQGGGDYSGSSLRSGRAAERVCPAWRWRRLRRQGSTAIIVGQSAYNDVYNTTFPSTWPYWGISRITDNSLSYQMMNGTLVTNHPMEPKAIQDEMGEVFDDYGRMSAKLGLELPFTTALNQTFVLQNYVDPATELVTERRSPDLEDHPQWRGHPPRPLPPVRSAGAQPGWLGRVHLPARPQRTGLEGHRQDKPAGGYHRRVAAGCSHTLPFAIPNSIRPYEPGVSHRRHQLTHPSTLGVAGVGFSDLDPTTGQPLVPPTQMT